MNTQRLTPIESIATWLIRGNNQNQKHILDTIASETEKHYDALAFDPENARRKPVSSIFRTCVLYHPLNVEQNSILEALVHNLPDETNSGRIRFDMNTTFIASTTATPIVSFVPSD